MELTDTFPMWIVLLIIPIVLIEVGLMVFALVDLIRRKRTKGPKWVWAIVIVLIEIIGPLVYLIAGREEDYDEEDEGAPA
jgi:hypothetical protein